MTNTKYRAQVNGYYKEFNNVYDWFKVYAANDLKLDTSKYYVDTKYFGKALFVSIREINKNKLIKTIYKNLNVASDFTLAHDGLYYNKAWSKSGNRIVVDGLGWTIDQVREHVLDSEVLPKVMDQSKYENIIDNIRYCFI